jgi:hypothetical protein
LQTAAIATPIPVIPVVIGEQLIFERAEGVLKALQGADRLSAALTGKATIEAIEGLL